MTRNEILTLAVLLLVLATDAALIAVALAAKRKVDELRGKVNAVGRQFGLTI